MCDLSVLEKKLIIKLEKNLKPKRLKHSMSVASVAVELAERFGEDKEKAHFAGLFHDLAKDLSKEEFDSLIKKYNIKLDKYEKLLPHLIHGKVCVYILENEYGIKDREILNAILYHTTGRENMTKFEKIICLADYIEEGRNFDGVERIRVLAKKDLNLALYHALNTTCIYLMNSNQIIHPLTVKARNSLIKEINIQDLMKGL